MGTVEDTGTLGDTAVHRGWGGHRVHGGMGFIMVYMDYKEHRDIGCLGALMVLGVYGSYGGTPGLWGAQGVTEGLGAPGARGLWGHRSPGEHRDCRVRGGYLVVWGFWRGQGTWGGIEVIRGLGAPGARELWGYRRQSCYGRGAAVPRGCTWHIWH